MHKQVTNRLLTLLALLSLLMVMALPAFAQEGEAEGEGDTTIVDAEGDTTIVDAEEAHEEAAEAEAEAGGIAALGVNTGFLIAQIINFGLLATILSLLIWRPLVNMLDARSAKIAKGLEDAAVSASARRNAEQEAETIRAEARAETQRILAEGRTRGEELARTIEAEARTAADATRAEARTSAEAERNRQLADLRGQVAAISVAVAQRLIGESLDAQRQQALITDFFSRVPEAARRMGGNVEVVSAMPLTEQEQSRVQQEVGGQNVTFRVDPSILGGLILRSEDRVVDASVRSGLSELTDRLA
jgi:F-type H+-transporting ATPase subunit b